MRYKIKAKSLDDFHKAKSLVVAGETRIFVSSEGRLALSTGDLSQKTKAELADLGARVVPDVQYQADKAA